MKTSNLLLVLFTFFLFGGFTFQLNQNELAKKAAKIHDNIQWHITTKSKKLTSVKIVIAHYLIPIPLPGPSNGPLA